MKHTLAFAVTAFFFSSISASFANSTIADAMPVPQQKPQNIVLASLPAYGPTPHLAQTQKTKRPPSFKQKVLTSRTAGYTQTHHATPPKPSKKPYKKTTHIVPTQAHALQISRLGDVEKSCGSLSEEAADMRDVIYQMEEAKAQKDLQSDGLTAAGAVGSFLVGTVTGGVGLAVGGFLLERNIENNKEEVDAIQDIAEQRRTLMMGIFNAKGCLGPIEHAMQNPEQLNSIDILANIEPASGARYQSELRRRYNN